MTTELLPRPTDRGRRAVRTLAAARFASAGGTQAAQVALAYTVFDQTGSAAWVSASLVASAGVAGLMGPVSGWMSDRLDRRRVMVGSELAGALGWLLVLFAGSPTMLVLTALVATAANAPFKAAANASVPNVVAAEDLPWANGTIATALNAAMVVGPLVAGVLLGVVGPNAVFGLNVVTFVVSARLLARLPGALAEAHPASTEAAHATWRSVLADRRRRLLVAVTALSFGAFGIILVADLPLVDHLGGGSVGYALLTTLWGVGAVGGSWAAARLPQRLETRALVLGTTAMAASVSSLTVLPNLTTVIVVGAIGGLGSGIVFPPWFSLLQRSASDAERGTTFALAETFEQTSFLAGMTIAGGMVGWVGPRATYLLPGALLLVAAAMARRIEPKAAPTGSAAVERQVDVSGGSAADCMVSA